jgi:UPF0755 protein
MNDRWLRAEERIRQSTEERRYRRSDEDSGDTGRHHAMRSGEARPVRGRGARHAAPDDDGWDEYEDTSIIPRYGDQYDAGSGNRHAAYGDPGYAEHGYEPAQGYGDPGYAERGYSGHGYAEQGFVDPGDPGYGEHDYADRGYATGEHDYATGEHGYVTGEYDSHAPSAVEYREDDYLDEDSRSAAAPPPRRGPQRAAPRGRTARAEQAPGQTTRKQSPRKQTTRQQTARKQTGRNHTARTSDAQTARRKGSRNQPERGRPGRGRRSRAASRKAEERKRRRRNLMYIGTVFVVLFAVAAVYAGYKLMGRLSGPEDFSGPTGPLAVVQVHPGDTAEQIAKTMVDKGVVKSSGAFYEAAVRNSNMNSVQPGYYAVPTHSKGADAVTALMSADSRVGNVVISEGRRLLDATDANTGSRADGIYRKIAYASCVGTGPEKKCVTYEQLVAAGASTDLNALGVPPWAIDQVRQVPDHARQLEGLIAAGTWDFDPSGTPLQILAQLVTESAHSYESTGLLTPNPSIGINLSPYQILIAASLVEREALPADMPRVARVIVNRLNANMPLEFDSTVNYTLDSTQVATSDADRAKRTPWNTYAMSGLPATPIASPSLGALRAMENPTVGPWLYFVTVDKQGTTLFTDSYTEHQRNIEKARESGILDSGH